MDGCRIVSGRRLLFLLFVADGTFSVFPLMSHSLQRNLLIQGNAAICANSLGQIAAVNTIRQHIGILCLVYMQAVYHADFPYNQFSIFIALCNAEQAAVHTVVKIIRKNGLSVLVGQYHIVDQQLLPIPLALCAGKVDIVLLAVIGQCNGIIGPLTLLGIAVHILTLTAKADIQIALSRIGGPVYCPPGHILRHKGSEGKNTSACIGISCDEIHLSRCIHIIHMNGSRSVLLYCAAFANAVRTVDMTCSRQLLLCHKHLPAHRALLTFRQSRLGAGGRYRRMDHNGVTVFAGIFQHLR